MSVHSALPFPASSGVALLFAAVFTITSLYTCAVLPPQQRLPLRRSSGSIIDLSSAAANFASGFRRISKAANAPSNYDSNYEAGPMNGIFIPFLWTQKYNVGFKGYAFGFWGVPINPDPDSFDFYLCVCLGQINNERYYIQSYGRTVRARLGSSTIFVEIKGDSFAMPVWIANLGCPLAFVSASLNVTPAANKERVLELRDGDGSLAWRTIIGDDGAFLELQESGNLVILDSANRTVWQSFQHPTDTLVVGQNFSRGMSLTSSDSVFSVAMEPRGLVFYLINSSQTGTTGPNNASFSILSSTLATSYPFVLRPNSFSIWSPDLKEGVLFCSLFHESHRSQADLVRLDRDGRLRFYAPTLQASINPINTFDCDYRHRNWGACDVPMECGPMGLCLPNASGPNHCTCPAAADASATTPVFKQIDRDDAHKGCRLTSSLSSNFCASSNASTLWDFLEVKHTATIFQFCDDTLSTDTPWTTTVPNCKEKCRNDCRCLGVIFNDDQSLCFTMTDHRLSLVQVPSKFNLSYTTFLKVGAAPKHHSITVVVAITCSAAVLILIAAVAFYGCQRGIFVKKPGRFSSENEDLEMQKLCSVLPTKFSHKELQKATQDFRNLIGKGAMGSVYAGALPDGKRIAVKKLKGDRLSNLFLKEVATMGKTSHLNIVQLVGYCWETDQQMLVCEYMEKGSLDGWLFEPAGRDKLLDWSTRFKIAKGIAKGLAYLHEGCSQPILHLDIKPQNILLDTDFEPKLADFGLARFMPRDASRVVTNARGTYGYMAPEICFSAAPVLSKKCDIYSLGIVLLQLVAGRKSGSPMATLNASNVGEEHDEQEHELLSTSKAIELEDEQWLLPKWAAKMCTAGRMMEVVDKQLQEAFCEEEASGMIEVALRCIQDNPSLRPSAATVVQWLERSSMPLESAPSSSVVHFQSRVKSSYNGGAMASMSVVSSRLAEDREGETAEHRAGKKKDP